MKVKKKHKKYFNLGPLDSPYFLNQFNLFLKTLKDLQYNAVFFEISTTNCRFISSHKQIILHNTINPPQSCENYIDK